MSESNDVNLELIRVRHLLHAHPEVSRQENATSKYIQCYLRKNATPDSIVKLDGAAFAAVYEGVDSGKTIMFRTELDALPIHETNENLLYRSKRDGVGHKCGHDGHMAIMIGLGKRFATMRPYRGRVVLLFQHDEETGTGARACCEHPNFEKIRPDFAFALHNFPGFPLHQIICRNGVIMSAVRCISISLYGKESHSAMPETGISPAYALSEITLKAREIQFEFDEATNRSLIVPVHTQMGVPSSGVMPGSGQITLTFRSERNEVIEEMIRELIGYAKKVSNQYGLTIEIETIEEFFATKNDPEAVSMITSAAKGQGVDFRTLDKPFRAGEDFGEITSRYKGAMFGVGAGINTPELHHPDYDFPDAIVSTGIGMFVELSEQFLSQ